MISEQLLALENLRFLSRNGGEPEFYDQLKTRLAEMSAGWGTLVLDDTERETLTANMRRLECELELLRHEASQRSEVVAQAMAEPPRAQQNAAIDAGHTGL